MDVGTQLRQAREARGLSVAKLAATTRIQARVLDGIERNDPTALPPRPYARGFIAAYAREVGLNPDETVRNYFAQFPDPAPETADAGRVLAPAATERSAWRTWLPVIGVVALVVTVGGLIPRRTAAPAANEATVGTTGTVSSADPTPSRPATPAPGLRPPVSLAAGNPPQPPVRAQSSPLVVTLEAEGSSWISARVDGTRRLYQMLQPGTRHTLHASREIVLRVGDAGAVRWSINGRDAVLMGSRGEVRNVTLTARE